MKLQLLLADHCPTCAATEQVWQRVCAGLDLPLEVLFTTEGTGKELAEGLNLQMFPALLADGRVCALGAPSEGTARDALRRLFGDGAGHGA